MGTSVSEDIALRVTSTADVSGLRATRAETGALSREAKAAARDIAAAADQGASAERGLAAAAAEAARSQDMVRISSEKALELERQAGGNKQRLIQLLQQYRREQLLLADATEAATAAAQQQNAARSAPSTPNAPSVGSDAAADVVRRVSTEVDKIPAKARTAANALSNMTLMAAAGGGGLRSIAVAAGSAADGIAALSTSAKVAASASGIGAVVTILAAAVLALREFNTEAKASDETLARLRDRSTADIDKVIADQRRRVEQMRKAAESTSMFDQIREDFDRLVKDDRWADLGALLKDTLPGVDTRNLKDYAVQLEILNKMEAERRDLLQQQRVHLEEQGRENDRRVADGSRSLELETLRTYQLKLQAGWFENLTTVGREGIAKLANQQAVLRREAELEREARDDALRTSFKHYDALGRELALTDEQKTQLATLLKQSEERLSLTLEQIEAQRRLNAETARLSLRAEAADFDMKRGDAYQTRLEQIELERQAEIAKTGDIAAANERAELRIRQLKRQTYNQIISDLDTIAQATLQSSERTIRALGHGADTLRRVMIGAQAAHAAVEAAIEWGKSIGSLAAGDLRGAGLHAASAAQLTAAAALGAREALGGGSSAGGAAVGPQYSNRDPRESVTNTTVIIQTVNPFSREIIGETSYVLRRAGTLNTPIYAPPTTGMRAA